MTKKKLTAVFLALLLVFFTSCGANTESDSETDNGAAIYTQTISLCALHSEDSGLINQVAPHLSSRADSMGYGGSCAERDEEVSLIITSDHELMRDERDEIVKRICMSGNLTFDDSDGNTFLSRSDFESVSLRFDNGYFIDVTLTAEGKENMLLLRRPHMKNGKVSKITLRFPATKRSLRVSP